MSQSVGKFLLSGIQFRRNFIGGQTLRTSFYTLIEVSVKLAPLWFIITAGGMYNSKWLQSYKFIGARPIPQIVSASVLSVPKFRRSSLTESPQAEAVAELSEESSEWGQMYLNYY